MNTIYLVTPSFNSKSTIDQTILSVVSQAGDFELFYHIQDGQSNDETVEILRRWQSAIHDRRVQTFCRRVVFSFESLPDSGIYDAVTRGFNKFHMLPDSFMGWINSDDILLPGALACVSKVANSFNRDQASWISGATSVLKDDMHIAHGERPTPNYALKNGMCDGIHWHFLQQEGTFFRRWLWDAADSEKILKNYRLAGDWNLWRVFAHHTELVEVPWALGSFRLRQGQLSQVGANDYAAEINRTVPIEMRRAALEYLGNNGAPMRRILKAHWPSGKLSIVERTSIAAMFDRYKRIFKKRPACPHDDKRTDFILFEGNDSTHTEIIAPAGSHRFFVVTPCLNAASTIDKTIQSVISQSGGFSVRYHVQDGGSNDGTLEKLRHWSDVIKKNEAYKNVRFSWSSAPDAGMYEALRAGFDSLEMAPDDFMTWINGDDVLMPDALSVVAGLSSSNPSVQWIGGTARVIDTNDEVVKEIDIPAPNDVIREGLCDGQHWAHLQQEGMFFRKSLWFRAKHALVGFRLAGDWSLWRAFALHAKYHQLDRPLGAFRRRPGQLSVARRTEYDTEIASALPVEQRTAAFRHLYAQRQSIQYIVVRVADATVAPSVEKKTAANYFESFYRRMRGSTEPAILRRKVP